MKESSRKYITAIPVKIPIEKLSEWGEAYAQLAKRTNAELFIISRNSFGDKAKFSREIADLKKKVQFFKERGLSVSACLSRLQ